MTAVTPDHALRLPGAGPVGARHVQELEGLRAIAALAVLTTHAGFLSGATGRHVLPGFLARMDIGVAIFFVLSGYLLYRPHARANAGLQARPALRTFWWRRAARLIPAWALVLVGVLILVPASRDSSWSAWAANLVQAQSLKQEWHLPGLAQLWSLSTEVMFYVSLPFVAGLVARLARGRRRRAELFAIGALAVLAQVFRAVAGHDLLPSGFTWLQTLPATLDWFAAGMALGVLTAHPGEWRRVTGAVRDAPLAPWVISACLLWVLTTRLAGPYDLSPQAFSEQTFQHLGYGIVALLVVAPSVVGARSPISAVLSHRLLAYLGRISYGVFLWHLPIMFALRELLGYRLFAGHFWITLLGTLSLSVPIAAASWHLLEEPVLRWVRRRTTPSVATADPKTQFHAS